MGGAWCKAGRGAPRSEAESGNGDGDGHRDGDGCTATATTTATTTIAERWAFSSAGYPRFRVNSRLGSAQCVGPTAC